MSIPPRRPRSALLRLLDGFFLLLGLLGLLLIVLPRRYPLEPSLEITLLRLALFSAIFLLAWGIMGTYQAGKTYQAWPPLALILLAVLTIAGWPTMMILDVRRAARANDVPKLCDLVRHIDQVGVLGLLARSARTQSLDALRLLAEQEAEGPPLVDMLCQFLGAHDDDPDLVSIKHAAAQHLLSVAKTSEDPLLLSPLAYEARLRGWEDDPDCRPLLEIWRERSDKDAF